MRAQTRLVRRGAGSSRRHFLEAVIALNTCCVALFVAASNVKAGTAQAETGSFRVAVTITNSGLNLVPSTVPAGSVVFKIVNKATSARDFEIAGEKTPVIGAGKLATLRVVVARRPYSYLSAGPGQARLTGVLGVFRPCANPTTSTVQVQVTTGVIRLSQSTVPCGTVTFVVTNKQVHGSWSAVHDFEVFVPTAARDGLSGLLHPGESAKVTIDIPFKGKVYYDDGVGLNNEIGGEGWLVVN